MDIHPIFSGRKIHFSRNDTGSSEHALEKKKVLQLKFHTLYKVELKKGHRFKCNFPNYKTQGGKKKPRGKSLGSRNRHRFL